MNVETVELIASLLALVALVGALVLVVMRVVATSSPEMAQLGRSVQRIALWAAFAVAATATAGSLYFSEVEHFVPCRFCWFQRIFMYPLSIVLLVAAIRRDRAVKYTAGPIAGIGALISTYHVGLERGWFEESSSCDPKVPCSVPWFEQWGFFTLASMAFCGFLAILALVFITFPPAADADLDVDDDSDVDGAALVTSTPGPSQEI